jgi:hypothetical protein
VGRTSNNAANAATKPKTGCMAELASHSSQRKSSVGCRG